MPTLVTPEQRQAAKREIVWQVEQGATARSSCTGQRSIACACRVHSVGEPALTDGRHGPPYILRGAVLAFVVEHCQQK
jgi:hypothetical protein